MHFIIVVFDTQWSLCAALKNIFVNKNNKIKNDSAIIEFFTILLFQYECSRFTSIFGSSNGQSQGCAKNNSIAIIQKVMTHQSKFWPFTISTVHVIIKAFISWSIKVNDWSICFPFPQKAFTCFILLSFNVVLIAST